MDEQERQELADEARKGRAFVWAAEGLLHRARQLAQEAEQRFYAAMGRAPDLQEV